MRFVYFCCFFAVVTATRFEGDEEFDFSDCFASNIEEEIEEEDETLIDREEKSPTSIADAPAVLESPKQFRPKPVKRDAVSYLGDAPSEETVVVQPVAHRSCEKTLIEGPKSFRRKPERRCTVSYLGDVIARRPSEVNMIESGSVKEEEADNDVIQVRRTKPKGNWIPQVETPAVESEPSPPSYEAIVKESVENLYHVMSRKDATELLSSQFRRIPSCYVSQAIGSTISQDRPDLAEAFLSASQDTILAYEIDNVFRNPDDTTEPAPRLAAFMRGIETVYHDSMASHSPDFTLLEKAILEPQIWDGPILF
jgi:hypothetical protein